LQLENAGYQVIEASNTQDARRKVAEGGYDLAILDLMMDEKDAGFTLSREIKNRDDSIPVILVTAVASETGLEFGAQTREERSWIRADALLDKPVRFEQLTREIQRLTKG
jgi:CheY-like chemotaxis protein